MEPSHTPRTQAGIGPGTIPTEEESHAEILLWQGKYRSTIVPLVGFTSLTLKWFGITSTESVLSATHAARWLILMVAALLVAYLLFHWGMAIVLRRRRRAAFAAVIAAIASDMIALFGVILLVTPPEHYPRALIVSLFTLQLTQLFFGWSATAVNLAFVGAGYTTLIAFGTEAGIIANPIEDLWDLGVFGIGVLAYLVLQGHVVARMRQLVELFSLAQEGDFSKKYEEGAGAMPDPVSVIGRAYNRMRTHLETIVLTDPLTGCYNRRGLTQLAEREVSRAIRTRKEFAVLAIDVDHFKRINDEFGHLTGDEVIREVGEVLRETLREVDLVARFGGEEFAIVAPESNEEGALVLAERVMTAFRTHRFRTVPSDVRITVSVGVAADVAHDEDAATRLLARADEALYVAKRSGRDRAVVWHAGMRGFETLPLYRASTDAARASAGE